MARLTSHDPSEFLLRDFKQRNVNPIGEFIYPEFPFIATPSLKPLEVSRKTCFDSSDFRPSPLRTYRSIYEEKNPGFYIKAKIWVFLWYICTSFTCYIHMAMEKKSL